MGNKTSQSVDQSPSSRQPARYTPDQINAACSSVRKEYTRYVTGMIENPHEKEPDQEMPSRLHVDCTEILDNVVDDRQLWRTQFIKILCGELEKNLPERIINYLNPHIAIAIGEFEVPLGEAVLNDHVQDGVDHVLAQTDQIDLENAGRSMQEELRRENRRIQIRLIKTKIAFELRDFLHMLLLYLVATLVGGAGTVTLAGAYGVLAPGLGPAILLAAGVVTGIAAYHELNFDEAATKQEVITSVIEMLSSDKAIDGLVEKFRNVLECPETVHINDPPKIDDNIIWIDANIESDENRDYLSRLRIKYPDIVAVKDDGIPDAAAMVAKNPFCGYQILSSGRLGEAVVETFSFCLDDNSRRLLPNVTDIHIFCMDERHREKLHKYPGVVTSVNTDYDAMISMLAEEKELPLACFLHSEEWENRLRYSIQCSVNRKVSRYANDLTDRECIDEFIAMRNSMDPNVREPLSAERMAEIREIFEEKDPKLLPERIVKLYTDDHSQFFWFLNRQLRGARKSARLLKFSALACKLTRAMTMCIANSVRDGQVNVKELFGDAQNHTLYRAMTVTSEVMEVYRRQAIVGNLIFFREFKSTSISEESARDVGFAGRSADRLPLLIEIDISEAIPTEIDPLRSYPLFLGTEERSHFWTEEKEVLIPPLSLFRVMEEFRVTNDKEQGPVSVLRIQMLAERNFILDKVTFATLL